MAWPPAGDWPTIRCVTLSRRRAVLLEKGQEIERLVVVQEYDLERGRMFSFVSCGRRLLTFG